MAFEKDLVGRTVTRERWVDNNYGVLVFDNGKAMVIRVELFDDTATVREIIQQRMAAIQEQADTYTVLTT